jgi:hypothetical protein
MTNLRTRIRHQLTRDVGLGEQFRDAQQALDGIPVTVLRKVEMTYAEPMTLGGFARPPEGIEAIRVIDLSAQETPVTCGGLAHFVWKPRQGGAQIYSIDGMSVAANGGKPYRFTFRITFAGGS